MSDDSNDWQPTGEQWAAITTAAAGMTLVSGPLGGALTGIGATAGACAANKMGWRKSNKDK